MDELDKIINAALVYADRREFLCRNVPRCPDCNHEQVQLIDYLDIFPAKWKCRICKHRFTFEPEKK